MHISKHFEQPSVEVMHQLIRKYSLATLITLEANGLCVNHIPLHLSVKPEPYGLLSGHVPRFNPVWRKASKGSEVVVVFQGPQAYISPSWYATKKESGRVVPTWNYTVVHAHGQMRVINDAQWLKSHLEQLTDQLEASFDHPWSVGDAPSDFTEKLLDSLVGIEIPITTLVGKWKVSQNRPKRDREGVACGLCELGGTNELLMSELVNSVKGK